MSAVSCMMYLADPSSCSAPWVTAPSLSGRGGRVQPPAGDGNGGGCGGLGLCGAAAACGRHVRGRRQRLRPEEGFAFHGPAQNDALPVSLYGSFFLLQKTNFIYLFNFYKLLYYILLIFFLILL